MLKSEREREKSAKKKRKLFASGSAGFVRAFMFVSMARAVQGRKIEFTSTTDLDNYFHASLSRLCIYMCYDIASLEYFRSQYEASTLRRCMELYIFDYYLGLSAWAIISVPFFQMRQWEISYKTDLKKLMKLI